MQILDSQIQSRLGNIVLTAPKGIDNLVEKSYMLGECAGLRLAAEIPKTLLETTAADIKAETEERELIANMKGESNVN